MTITSPRAGANVYPSAPTTGYDPESHRRLIAQSVNLALQGKLNAVTSVTLTASTTTTTLTDPRIGPSSFIGLSPTTSNAAGALGTTYVSAKADGSATITHANATSVDRTFDALIIG